MAIAVREFGLQCRVLIIIIITNVFVKHKIVSIETILSAYTHTHTHTLRGTRTHEYYDYTKLKLMHEAARDRCTTQTLCIKTARDRSMTQRLCIKAAVQH